MKLFLANLGKFAQKNPWTVFNLGILMGLILGVIAGPWLYPISLDQIDFGQSLTPPSPSHWLGTNDLGQDQLARLLTGGRISLAVGFAAMLLSLTLGTAVGLSAGFFGGWLDLVLTRLTELFQALPQLPLVLLAVYLFKEPMAGLVSPQWGVFILVVAVIGGLNWMTLARLVRAQSLKLREMEFMQAARTLGASPLRLILFHLLPNVLDTLIVAATLAVGNAIIAESTLSFLGLGFPPDVPTWGQMLYAAKDYLDTAPYLAFFPGLAIFLTVLSINSLGDSLRDALWRR
ncbi:MAG: ABC transporter permease subunit [Cyanobacteria bacterium RI_101]|nr:ABC transporter permease subunit [Cyanobacteria bacterium RI_101]